MSAPFQVGITGGIGSGKSTVATIFNCLGVPVYDADSRAKILMNNYEQLKAQIKSEFGNQAYDKSGKLDRRYLAQNVFGFPDRLQKLNNLVHPRVAEDYAQWIASHKSFPYVLKEAALLFEAGSAKQLDKIIVVAAPEHLRIKRVKSRDKRSEEEVRNIIQQQFPQEKKTALADFIINNDEETAVIPQVLQTHQNILELIESVARPQ